MKQLRPYQADAKNNLRQSVKKGNRRIVLYAPTGAGKSIMAVDLVSSLVKNGKRVAFIANRIGLVMQFSAHLQAAKIDHGIIQGENTFNIRSQCVVCSIDTLAKRGFPERMDYVIIDEVHFVASNAAMKKLMFDNPEMFVIGLTATPFAKGMAKPYIELKNEPLFQDIVITATIRELIDNGSLVDCEIFAPSEPDLAGVKMTKNAYGEMDYNDKQLGAAVDKPELIGDIVENWFKLAKGKRTVIFATNVAHSKHIVAQFQDAGINAEHIDGYMDAEEKQPIMERFANHETLIISNVAMLKEGWDVPSCEVMILAKPTRSLTAWVQMVGRILRPFDGKTHGIVIDHSGSVHRLGFPTDDLPLELCDGSAKKSKSEQKEAAPKKECKCPKCHLIKKSSICPNCGFEYIKPSDVEVADGKLSKVKKVSIADKQDWYSQLLSYGSSKGYNPHWADHKYREKFEVWPRGLQHTAKEPCKDVVGWIIHHNIARAKRAETRA